MEVATARAADVTVSGTFAVSVRAFESVTRGTNATVPEADGVPWTTPADESDRPVWSAPELPSTAQV